MLTILVALGFAAVGFYLGRKTRLLPFLRPSAETSAAWQVSAETSAAWQKTK